MAWNRATLSFRASPGNYADTGRHSAEETRIVLAMTRQDIADYLGLTIETVSRPLSQLEREGIIVMKSGRHIDSATWMH